MIESRLAVLMGERVLRISQVVEATGISKPALTDLYYRRSKGIQFKTIEKLCEYFDCGIGDLLLLKKDERTNAS